MKFAIRKLAITCMLPSALWYGPLPSEIQAQSAPSANSKLNMGMPQRRNKVNTQQAPQQARPAPAPAPAINYPRPTVPVAAPQTVMPIQQMAGPRPQPQSSNSGPAGETDVQRELRLLYEKSGQEMPTMDLSELDVPEPQPGVAPGSQGEGPRPGGQYNATAAPPPKAPNLFERVFLGRKAAPAPRPQPRPQVPPQPFRPAQQPPANNFQNGTQQGAGGTPNYRPFQQNQGVNGGQAAPQQNRPQTQPGAGGQQRPAVNAQPANNAQQYQQPAQSQASQQQPAPQVQIQRLPGQPSVIPPQPFNVPGQPAAGAPRPIVQPQQQTREDEAPLLEEEPEESLEIDLNPMPANQPPVQAPAAAADRPAAGSSNRAVTPQPANSGTVEAPRKPAPVVDETPSGNEAEANPFSGLKLNLPEAAVPAPAATATRSSTPATLPVKTPVTATPATPAANLAAPAAVIPEKDPFGPDSAPKSTVSKTPAVNESEEQDPFGAASANTKAAAPATTPKGKQPDPFFDDDDAEETPQVVAPKEVQENAPPAANKPAVIPQQITSERSEVPVTKTVDQAAPAKSTATVEADERLRKLAEAREKTGLKGFCPVMLRQRGQLIETKPQFNATYQGKKFQFSSGAAKAAFEKEPHLFAPMHGGLDGVTLLDEDKQLPGSLDHALWFQGRLYLFATKENRAIFVNDPESYLDDSESESGTTKANASAASNSVQAAKPAAPAVIAPAKNAPATIPNLPPIAPPVTPPAVIKNPAPTAAQEDELPVLSDDLGDLPPLDPVVMPSHQRPTQTPAPVAPKPAATPDKPTTVTPAGPRLEIPMMKKATRNTPASYTVPVKPGKAPSAPRLISPDLQQLSPPTR